jgi:pseudouridine-5'-phosphate glycosidase
MRGGFPGYKSTSLPAVLSDGATAITVMSYGDIAAALRGIGSGNNVKITPVAEDSLGGVHRGEPFDVDISEYEKMSA